jgi:hypothetical protein
MIGVVGDWSNQEIRGDMIQGKGDHVRLLGSYSKLTGSHGHVSGERNVVLGHENHVFGKHNLVIGFGCTIEGETNTLIEQTGTYEELEARHRQHEQSHLQAMIERNFTAPASPRTVRRVPLTRGGVQSSAPFQWIPSNGTNDAYSQERTIQARTWVFTRLPPPVSTSLPDAQPLGTQVQQTPGAIPCPGPERKDTEWKEGEAHPGCQICFQHRIKAVCVPCGHANLCLTCARKIAEEDEPECPFCFGKLTAMMEVFYN